VSAIYPQYLTEGFTSTTFFNPHYSISAALKFFSTSLSP